MSDGETLVHVGVVGGGLMGGGIAEAVARAGHRVTVFEPIEPARESSFDRIRGSVARSVRGGKLSGEEAEPLIERILYASELSELAPCALVVEAVV
jgi:3-hydroxybutyryl-CoA dehydrogenase